MPIFCNEKLSLIYQITFNCVSALHSTKKSREKSIIVHSLSNALIGNSEFDTRHTVLLCCSVESS